MKLRTFFILFGLMLGFVVALLVFYEPKVDGIYKGRAQDTPAGAVTHITLVLKQQGDQLTGELRMGPEMKGGGLLTGSRDGKYVHFVTTDDQGYQMTWSGYWVRVYLEGEYMLGTKENPGLGFGTPMGGWSVTRQQERR